MHRPGRTGSESYGVWVFVFVFVFVFAFAFAFAFAFVKANQAVHAIATMCRVLEVSRSGYYAWLRRGPSQRTKLDRCRIRPSGFGHIAGWWVATQLHRGGGRCYGGAAS